MDPLFLAAAGAAILLAGLSIGLLVLTLGARRAAGEARAVAEARAHEIETLRTAREAAESARIRAEAETGRLPALEAELKTERAAREAVNGEFAALKAQIEADRRHHEDKLAALERARKEMADQFKLTATEVLKTSGEALSKTGRENIDALLKPLKEQLKGFQDKVEQDTEKRSVQTGALQSLVQVVREDAERMSGDARNLANALRSSSKMQGDWGELVLASILERAGLREGEEFHTQQSETAEDGSRLRPDIVVDMPDGHRLVIDSKVSLTAFERCVNAEDEEARAAALKQHLGSMRTHIKTLGEKDYAQFYEGVSFTFMFVPLEGAATLALQSEPGLTLEAAEHDVMIATPTTLMMAMRTIQNLWRIERQNRHALEIADSAGRLYDKFAGFLDTFDKVGSGLASAQRAFDAAKGQLSEGRGNLVGRTETLKKLGAKARKSLPADYVHAAEAGEGEDAPAALPEPAPEPATTDS